MNTLRASIRETLTSFGRLGSATVLLLCLATGLPAADKHCLWKVDGPKASVYLLGSVHVLTKKDYPLPAPMEKAFTESAIVYFETDIAAMDDPKVQAKFLAKGQQSEGKSLKDGLTKETYAKLNRHLDEFGLPAGSFDTFQPWFVAIALMTLEFPKLGVDPKYGVDKHLHQRAVDDGKSIVPLETVDFQINLLATLGKEDGEEFLKSTLDDIASVRVLFADLLKAWRDGDAGALEKMLHESLAKHPTIAKRFITNRNKRWIKEIEKLLGGDKTAIVVAGAAHMVGKDSVVELLKQKGFKVTQQ